MLFAELYLSELLQLESSYPPSDCLSFEAAQLMLTRCPGITTERVQKKKKFLGV